MGCVSKAENELRSRSPSSVFLICLLELRDEFLHEKGPTMYFYFVYFTNTAMLLLKLSAKEALDNALLFC